jgi:hypothetical protein
MKGPEHVETTRLVLRKPTAADAEAVYTRYSSDPEAASDVNRSRFSRKEFQLSVEVELSSFRIVLKLCVAPAMRASPIEPYCKMAFYFSWSDLC